MEDPENDRQNLIYNEQDNRINNSGKSKSMKQKWEDAPPKKKKIIYGIVALVVLILILIIVLSTTLTGSGGGDNPVNPGGHTDNPYSVETTEAGYGAVSYKLKRNAGENVDIPYVKETNFNRFSDEVVLAVEPQSYSTFRFGMAPSSQSHLLTDEARYRVSDFYLSKEYRESKGNVRVKDTGFFVETQGSFSFGVKDTDTNEDVLTSKG